MQYFMSQNFYRFESLNVVLYVFVFFFTFTLNDVLISYIFKMGKQKKEKKVNLQNNFIEITLRHGCSPVNLLHIFRTPFPRNTSEWLLLRYPFNLKKFCKQMKDFILKDMLFMFGVG